MSPEFLKTGNSGLLFFEFHLILDSGYKTQIMKYTLTLLALSIFLQGCASLSKKKIQNQKSLSSENFFKFNGLYSNTSVDSTKYYNPILWRFFEKKSKYINNWDSTFTEAKFITSKKISLVLYSKKLSVLKSIIVKGKIKEGCFYVRNKFMIYPLPPLILGYDNKKTRICNFNIWSSRG